MGRRRSRTEPRSLPGGLVDRVHRHAVLAGLAVATCWSAARNLGVLPRTWDEDEVVYYRQAVALARHVYNLEPAQFLALLTRTPRPPLVLLSDAMAMLVLPQGPWFVALARLGWVALLLWSVGGLVKDLMSRWEAPERQGALGVALAVALIATAPVVLQLGSSLMFEVPLAAVSAWSLRLLLRVAWTDDTGAAAWAGVACGLGLLLKWSFPVAVVGPVAVLLVASLRRKEGLRRWLIVAGVTLAVAGPWYLASARWTIPYLIDVSIGPSSTGYGATSRSPAEEWGYYLPVLAGALLWWPLAAAAWLGLARSARSRAAGVAPLLAAVCVPALLFTLIVNKEVRYLVPVVPALAALGGAGLSSLHLGGALRAGLAALLLLAAGRGLVVQGAADSERTTKSVGPLAVGWDEGAGLPAVPVQVSLGTPLGRLLLWSRGDDSFQYRRVARAVPFHEIDQLAQRTNPGGDRAAAVLSPESALWTPLWAEGIRGHGWTEWRPAQCDSELVGEAAYILTEEPPREGTPHCHDAWLEAMAQFEVLAPDLQELGRWALNGRHITLWVRRARLYPDEPKRAPVR